MLEDIVTYIFHFSLAAWVGTVVFLNIVIIPLLNALPIEERGAFISRIFHRAFHFATVVASLVGICGLVKWMILADIQSAGISIIIGGSMLLALIIFHLMVVWKLLPMIHQLKIGSDEPVVLRMHKFLRIIPRFGGVVLIVGASLVILG